MSHLSSPNSSMGANGPTAVVMVTEDTVWYCGHCGDGPYSVVNITHCTRVGCHRRRDEYARYEIIRFPVENYQPISQYYNLSQQQGGCAG